MRCTICGIGWPDGEDYKTCPGCGEETRRISAEHQFEDEAAARSEASRLRFEDFYAEREERRLAEAALSPEDLGSIDALTEQNRAPALTESDIDAFADISDVDPF